MEPSRSNVAPGQRTKERFGGLFLLVIGGGLLAWTWRSALAEGAFSMKGALLAPAFATLGLALIIVPGYRTERLARGEDLSTRTGYALITPRWWGVLVLALLTSLGNLGLLRGW